MFVILSNTKQVKRKAISVKRTINPNGSYSKQKKHAWSMKRSGTQNFLISGPLTDENSLPSEGTLESLSDPTKGMI